MKRIRQTVADILIQLAEQLEADDRLADALECRLLCDDILPTAGDPLAVLDKAPRPEPADPYEDTQETLLSRIRGTDRLTASASFHNGEMMALSFSDEGGGLGPYDRELCRQVWERKPRNALQRIQWFGPRGVPFELDERTDEEIVKAGPTYD